MSFDSPRRRPSKEWSLRRVFLASLAEVTQRDRSCSDMSALATNCLESEIGYNGGCGERIKALLFFGCIALITRAGKEGGRGFFSFTERVRDELFSPLRTFVCRLVVVIWFCGLATSVIQINHQCHLRLTWVDAIRFTPKYVRAFIFSQSAKKKKRKKKLQFKNRKTKHETKKNAFAKRTKK